MFNQLKERLRMLMIGRNGLDRLSLVMLWAGVGLLLIATLLSSAVLNLLAMAIYVLAIMRVFSRNIEKRAAENRAFVSRTGKIQKAITHRRNRYKNRKQYRYFKCPNCKSWLRVPRGAGQVKVKCGNCGHQFSYIAR